MTKLTPQELDERMYDHTIKMQQATIDTIQANTKELLG